MKNRTKRRSLKLCVEQLEGRVVPSTVAPPPTPPAPYEFWGSTNWSGISMDTTQGAVTAVSGSWIVPAVTGSGKGYSATWVGIDGYGGSHDVLQAGCDADVSLSDGVTQYRYCPWWEWYPDASVQITNMPVSPGDVLHCLICLQAGSTSVASIFLGNKTTAKGLTFTAEIPPSASLSGNCAEWIIEATGDWGPLARFSQVDFIDCDAGTNSGQTVTTEGGTAINMVDGDDVVSTGRITGPSGVQIVYGNG